MSSSSSASATSSSRSPYPSSTQSGIFSGNGGVSSSLYLFTFLITIVVLGVISAALILRAYYVRRQFQLRVEEAIRRGQPLPQDAVRALGLNRPKPKKLVGPEPSLWEAEMRRDDEKEEWRGEKMWDGLNPLAVVHFPAGEVPLEHDITLADLPQRRRAPRFLRPFISPAPLPDTPQHGMNRHDTRGSRQEGETTHLIPEVGAEVVVGVMIALPVEEGKGAEKWMVEEAEEAEVPEVCLGVMGCTLKAGD